MQTKGGKMKGQLDNILFIIGERYLEEVAIHRTAGVDSISALPPHRVKLI